MQKNKRYTKKASIFVNDVIFAHEKNQKLTVVNPEQTIKKKNPITSVKDETRKVSNICEKNSSSKLFIEPSFNLCFLIIVVVICSMRTLFQSSFLYYHI